MHSTSTHTMSNSIEQNQNKSTHTHTYHRISTHLKERRGDVLRSSESIVDQDRRVHGDQMYEEPFRQHRSGE